MKKIINIVKPFLIPVVFELTIILSQSFAEKNSSSCFFYLIFTLVAVFCFMYNDFIVQLIIAILIALGEFCLIKYQKVFLDLFSSLFNQNFTTRNTTDNFLFCVFLQFVAFVVAAIIAQKKKKRNDQIMK